ncbi:hypothetical protein [Actinomadura sp. 6N118]|uniref:hypothetical protein n=1 Tax=Actinomadura sp. 6N118 TaxID=3375151 RepID=UPI003796C643
MKDLRVARAPATPEDLEALETDVLAGFMLARAAAGLSDGTISSDVVHLEQVRAWFGRPLWEMEPADADAYLGKVLRSAVDYGMPVAGRANPYGGQSGPEEGGGRAPRLDGGGGSGGDESRAARG